MAHSWISVADNPPPEGVVVMTKISPPDRNEQSLKRSGRLWYLSDGSMYVYYTPTHWRPIHG